MERHGEERGGHRFSRDRKRKIHRCSVSIMYGEEEEDGRVEAQHRKKEEEEGEKMILG